MGNEDKKHLLIVEDSPDLQALLSQLFSGEGYTLSRAFNGREALELLRSMDEPPSLILLDLMMPVMDGIEFRNEQRSDPKIASIPVIIMTADGNSQAKAEQLGVADFVRKPISDIDKLIETIERLRIHA